MLVTAAVVFAAASFGCAGNKEMSNAASDAAAKGKSAASSAAVANTAQLWSALGGTAGVTNLANSFGTKIGQNPAVTKFLDATAIGAVQNGLFNSIAAAAGQSLMSGPTNLAAALQGKSLDQAAVQGLSEGLMEAGKGLNLGPEHLASLTSLMAPVAQAVATGK
jgi:hypothetical protein